MPFEFSNCLGERLWTLLFHGCRLCQLNLGHTVGYSRYGFIMVCNPNRNPNLNYLLSWMLCLGSCVSTLWYLSGLGSGFGNDIKLVMILCGVHSMVVGEVL